MGYDGFLLFFSCLLHISSEKAKQMCKCANIPYQQMLLARSNQLTWMRKIISFTAIITVYCKHVVCVILDGLFVNNSDYGR
jgi:hypothetical protein